MGSTASARRSGLKIREKTMQAHSGRRHIGESGSVHKTSRYNSREKEKEWERGERKRKSGRERGSKTDGTKGRKRDPTGLRLTKQELESIRGMKHTYKKKRREGDICSQEG